MEGDIQLKDDKVRYAQIKFRAPRRLARESGAKTSIFSKFRQDDLNLGVPRYQALTTEVMGEEQDQPDNSYIR